LFHTRYIDVHGQLFNDLARTTSSAMRKLRRRLPRPRDGGVATPGVNVMSNLPRKVAQPLAFSVTEACELASIGKTTFYKLLRAGAISAHKVGRRTLVIPDVFEEELKSLPRAGRVS